MDFNIFSGKLIIAGSRHYRDYDLIENIIDMCLVQLNNPEITEIVSGMAKGIDTLGIEYANKHNIKVKEFPANWEVEGKAAGYKRNERMAKYGDMLIAIWDGESRGTKHMIDIAVNNKLPTIVYILKKDRQQIIKCQKGKSDLILWDYVN